MNESQSQGSYPTIEVQHLHKTLRWQHGLYLALGMAAGPFLTVGYMIGAIGAWAAVAVLAIVAVVGLLQNFLFAEMAAMFPEKSGGIALYAHEAWKRYFAPIGALAAFGYWIGWSLVLSIVGVTIGSMIQAQWFPNVHWTVSTGLVTLTLGHFIGAGTIVLSWGLNILGIKVAVRVNQIVGAVFAIVLAVIALGPFVKGGWHSSNLTWHLAGPWGGWKGFIVWMYIAAWMVYGSELCAAFAPEYKDTVRDTRRAMMSSALMMMAVFVLTPMGAAGGIGEKAITENPITYGVTTVNAVLGSGLGSVVTATVIAAFFLSMVSSSGDASRALYGLAKDDMTIKQLNFLNRFGVPSRSLTADMLINILIIAFVGSPLAILLASNIGYIFSVLLADVAFLLLRRDRPDWPRPFRLGPVWLPIALVVSLFNGVLLVVGIISPDLAGYGGLKETIIGFCLLFVGVVLFFYRRVVQDRGPLHLREATPAIPASGDA